MTILPKKPNKPTMHKNLDAFFRAFPSMNYENALLVNDMPYKNLFNPPSSATFL